MQSVVQPDLFLTSSRFALIDDRVVFASGKTYAIEQVIADPVVMDQLLGALQIAYDTVKDVDVSWLADTAQNFFREMLAQAMHIWREFQRWLESLNYESIQAGIKMLAKETGKQFAEKAHERGIQIGKEYLAVARNYDQRMATDLIGKTNFIRNIQRKSADALSHLVSEKLSPAKRIEAFFRELIQAIEYTANNMKSVLDDAIIQHFERASATDAEKLYYTPYKLLFRTTWAGGVRVVQDMIAVANSISLAAKKKKLEHADAHAILTAVSSARVHAQQTFSEIARQVPIAKNMDRLIRGMLFVVVIGLTCLLVYFWNT